MNLLLDLLKEDGFELVYKADTNGGEYSSPCPFCEDGTDRFVSWPEEGETGRYWCRVCEENGDAIQYLRDIRELSFEEAKKIAEEYCPDDDEPKVKWKRNNNMRNFKNSVVDSAVWQQFTKELIEECKDYLNQSENSDQFEYLIKRGLTKEMIEKFHLGWNPEDLLHERKTWGLTVEKKEDSSNRKLWIPSGVVIPFIENDEVVRIRIRRPIKDDYGRYVVLSGSNANQFMTIGLCSDYIIVVESELDAILIAQEANNLITVMAAGSAQNKPDRRSLKLLNEAEKILISLDYDDAGNKAVENYWLNNFTNAEHWPVPEGKDPGEAHEKGVDIKEWVLAGLPDEYVNYLFTKCIIAKPND